MKLTVVNGSPRGQKGNSGKIGKWITKHVSTNSEHCVEEIFIAHHQKHQDQLQQLKSVDYLLFIFPLYVDSMPAVVKSFFETMEIHKEDFKGKHCAFLLHSGFPEAKQSRMLERIVKYFATKVMEMQCHGVMILGGSESLQFGPEQMFGSKMAYFERITQAILQLHDFKETDLIGISSPEVLTPSKRLFLPLSNFFWNRQLKQNGAYKKRYEKPYL